MKHPCQNKYNKIHGRVIVFIKDDVPHAGTFRLHLILFRVDRAAASQRSHPVFGFVAAIASYRMLSPSSYRPVHHSQIKAAHSPHPGDFPHNTYMGPFSPNHTLAEPGDFSHPHRSLPGQNCGMRGRRVDRALFSGEAVSKTITSGGKEWPPYP